MKLKVRPTDFKVIERLQDDVLESSGPHRLYRVRKEKLTSIEAATELANLVGVTPADISMAGLKDRQGVTTQYMSIERGPSVSVQQKTLGIQTVGWTAAPLDSHASEGNDFTIVVRDLGTQDTDRVRSSLDAVREHGLPNYFDDQRFGNLRHGQGWIVLDLLKGDVSGALKRLIASSSPYEPPARRKLKDALWRSWGNWADCRSISGKLGRHHSVFEHLKRTGDDFAGAFGRVGTRERLIHLYAFQSHLWNRALSLWIEENVRERFSLSSIEGKLRFPRGELPMPDAWDGALILPGERLQGVDDPDQRALFERVLDDFGLAPDDLSLPDVPGFQLKPEARPAVSHPIELRIRPAEQDNEFRGRKMLRMSFGLPRGAYATMVIRRLVGPVTHGGDVRRDDRQERTGDGGRPAGRRGGGRGSRGRGYGRGAGGGGPRGDYDDGPRREWQERPDDGGPPARRRGGGRGSRGRGYGRGAGGGGPRSDYDDGPRREWQERPDDGGRPAGRRGGSRGSRGRGYGRGAEYGGHGGDFGGEFGEAPRRGGSRGGGFRRGGSRRGSGRRGGGFGGPRSGGRGRGSRRR